MEIRVDNAGEVTATAAAIDSHESNAALKSERSPRRVKPS
jgi:hypothetical protein